MIAKKIIKIRRLKKQRENLVSWPRGNKRNEWGRSTIDNASLSRKGAKETCRAQRKGWKNRSHLMKRKKQILISTGFSSLINAWRIKKEKLAVFLDRIQIGSFYIREHTFIIVSQRVAYTGVNISATVCRSFSLFSFFILFSRIILYFRSLSFAGTVTRDLRRVRHSFIRMPANYATPKLIEETVVIIVLSFLRHSLGSRFYLC